jgi:MFS superfamily sulfate permease-like transporter
LLAAQLVVDKITLAAAAQVDLELALAFTQTDHLSLLRLEQVALVQTAQVHRVLILFLTQLPQMVAAVAAVVLTVATSLVIAVVLAVVLLTVLLLVVQVIHLQLLQSKVSGVATLLELTQDSFRVLAVVVHRLKEQIFLVGQ